MVSSCFFNVNYFTYNTPNNLVNIILDIQPNNDILTKVINPYVIKEVNNESNIVLNISDMKNINLN